MPRTLERPTRAAQYLPPAAVSAEAFIASRLGITEGTAHQRLYGVRPIAFEAAICWQGLAQAGGRERADRWLTPLILARAGARPERLGPDFMLRIGESDRAEDAAREAMLLRGDREAAEAWVEKQKREIADKLSAMVSVVAHYGLERGLPL